MEETFTICVYLDAPVYNWLAKIRAHLTHEELLKLWREFKKWILIHVGEYLLNKRHIVWIKCVDWDKESIKRYLNVIMWLEEDPTLNNNNQ